VNRLQGESPGSDFDSQQGAEIFTFNTVAWQALRHTEPTTWRISGVLSLGEWQPQHETYHSTQSKSRSQSHIATDGQSVSVGAEPQLELTTRYLLLFDTYGLVFVKRPLWW
jgi:hypothetical protein